jgi:hypothetical protein
MVEVENDIGQLVRVFHPDRDRLFYDDRPKDRRALRFEKLRPDRRRQIGHLKGHESSPDALVVGAL